MKLLSGIFFLFVLPACSDSVLNHEPVARLNLAVFTDESLLQKEEYGDQIYAALGGHQRALEAAKQSQQQKLIKHAQENVEFFENVIAKWREGKNISAEREAQLEDRRMYGYQALETTIKMGMDPLENLEHSIYEHGYLYEYPQLMK